MAKKKSSKGKKRQVAAPPQPSEALLRQALKGEVDDIRPADALNQLCARRVPRLSALLVDLATASDDIDLRATAAQALGTDASLKHKRTLVRVLDDEDPEVVRRAAEALARIGGEAELKGLRALRPRNPVAKRAVDMAKTLISYRTGSTSGRLRVPKPEEILELADAKADAIAVNTMSAGTLEGLAAHLKRVLPTLPVADPVTTIECGKAQYLLVFHRDLAKRRNLEPLGKASSVLGALFRRDQIDGSYYLDAHILTHPGAGKTLRIFVMRGSGEVSHYGRLASSEEGATFEISALNTRHTRPIAFEGTLRFGTLDITLERAQFAVEKSVVQPKPKRPRQLRTAVR